MVYGYYITDTVGNERFFVEGCSHCRISTGGQHEPNCPCKDIKVPDGEIRFWEISEDGLRRCGEAWPKLAQV